MADKIVEIPNVGRVAFPAAMSDEEIIKAIQAMQTPAAAPVSVGREAGLAVRPMAQAALTAGGMLPMAVDPLVNLYNLATGSQVPTMTQAVPRTLTAMGLPEPQTPQERVMQDVATAGYGVGGAAQLAARALPMVRSPVARGFTETLATSPRAQTAAALSAATAGGMLREGGAPPAAQVGGAMLAGMVAPGGPTLSTTRRAIAAPREMVRPFTQEGREVIVGNVLRQMATDPERAIANLQAAQSTVPGVRVTTAAGARDPGLAAAETPIRALDVSGAFPSVLSANQQGLLESFRRLSGRPGSVERAETKRQQITAPLRESAFANAQPVNVAPITAAIESTMTDPAKQRQTVDQAMRFVSDLLAKRVDPRRAPSTRWRFTVCAKTLQTPWPENWPVSRPTCALPAGNSTACCR